MIFSIYMGGVRYSQSVSKSSESGIEAPGVKDELPDVRDFLEIVRQLNKEPHDCWGGINGTLGLEKQTVEDNNSTGKPESQVEESNKPESLWLLDAELAEIVLWIHELENEMKNVELQLTKQDKE